MRFQQHQDVELLQLLVEGPQSFAKRVQYSRQFSTLWRQTQSGCVEDVFEACANLSFCGSRYHSRTEPMITFLMKLSPCLQVLKLVSESREPSHRAEVAWASNILKACSGVAGFHRLCPFAVEADFFMNCSLLVRQQDTDEGDVAVSQDQVVDCLERAQAMFDHGMVFCLEPNETFTWHLLSSIKSGWTLFFGTEEAAQMVRVGWPSSEKALRRPQQFSRSLVMLRESVK